MSLWLSPTRETLRSVIQDSSGSLLLCSPFISRPGLDVIADSLTDAVSRIEVWTKLDPHDWLTGASDPEGLLDFISQVENHVSGVSLRQAGNLHAKIIVSDGPRGIAGSANLTAGGFGGNLEVARVASGSELEDLRIFVNSMRPKLTPVPLDEFSEFVAQCLEKVDSQEALLDLIRGEMPFPEFAGQPLKSYGGFLAFLDSQSSTLAGDILSIARNLDRNNNSGKVKQAFFGVQRFIQEYPQHLRRVASLPDNEWFDVSQDPMADDWRRFLEHHGSETNQAFAYSLPTLISIFDPDVRRRQSRRWWRR